MLERALCGCQGEGRERERERERERARADQSYVTVLFVESKKQNCGERQRHSQRDRGQRDSDGERQRAD